MKVSQALLGTMLFASTASISQVNTTLTDSALQKCDSTTLELEKKLKEMGYEKQIKSVSPEGTITYEFVRKKYNCPNCGRG